MNVRRYSKNSKSVCYTPTCRGALLYLWGVCEFVSQFTPPPTHTVTLTLTTTAQAQTSPLPLETFRKEKKASPSIWVISGLVLTITEITVNTHTHTAFDHQLTHLSLVFSPLFLFSSCYPLHSFMFSPVVSLSRAKPSINTSLTCKQRTDCFLFLCNLHSLLSCCIIYVCHYPSFEPQRRMLSQILFIFPCDFTFAGEEQQAWQDRYWYTVACLQGLKGCKGWVWCRNGTAN